MRERTTWIVEYRCGCSDDAPRKRDLLNYCAKHGDSARCYYKPPGQGGGRG